MPPFSWPWEPRLLLFLAVLAVGYGLAVGPLRARLAPTGTPFPRKEAVTFAAALGLLYLTLGSPLHTISAHYLFSLHMVQHNLLIFAVPPLLLRGVPGWLWDRWLRPASARAVARFLTKPIIVFLVFNLVFDGWHLPALYEQALRHPVLHDVQHLSFLVAASLMWWPLLNPSTRLLRPSFGAQLVYVFLLSVSQMVVFGFVTFASHPLYPTYAAAPRLWGISPLNDQQFGGALMNIGGTIAFLTALGVAFFRLVKAENEPPPPPRFSAHRLN